MVTPSEGQKSQSEGHKSPSGGHKSRKRGRPRRNVESYVEARRRKEVALADLRRLEVVQAEAKLIHEEAAMKRLWELIRAEREAWLNWPADVASSLAATLGVGTAAVEIALEQAIRAKLEKLEGTALAPAA